MSDKTGRPPKGDRTQNQRIYVRAIENDKLLFEKAAKLAKMTLSEWVRDRLFQAARQEVRRKQ